MLYNCKSLKESYITNFDIDNVETKEYTHYGCDSLEKIGLTDTCFWRPKKLEDMSYMFYDCKSLSIIPDFSKCDFSNIERMSFMFSGCIQLKKNNNIIKIFD